MIRDDDILAFAEYDLVQVKPAASLNDCRLHRKIALVDGIDVDVNDGVLIKATLLSDLWPYAGVSLEFKPSELQLLSRVAGSSAADSRSRR